MTAILQSKFLGLQVCSDEQDMEKLTEEVNRLVAPVDDVARRRISEAAKSGIVLAWRLSSRPGVAVVDCAEKPGFRHYIFECLP